MTLTAQQQKAKALIYEDGKSQKEAAAEVGVSEKSVGTWIDKFRWEDEFESRLAHTDAAALLAPLNVAALINNMKVKKAQAFALIEQKGYNQKEAARAVGVSEQTMVLWVKENEPVSLSAFISHLKSSNEILHKAVLKALQFYKSQTAMNLRDKKS